MSLLERLFPLFPFILLSITIYVPLFSDDLRVILKYVLPMSRRFSFATKRFIRFTVIALVVHFYAARLKILTRHGAFVFFVVETKLPATCRRTEHSQSGASKIRDIRVKGNISIDFFSFISCLYTTNV